MKKTNKRPHKKVVYESPVEVEIIFAMKHIIELKELIKVGDIVNKLVLDLDPEEAVFFNDYMRKLLRSELAGIFEIGGRDSTGYVIEDLDNAEKKLKRLQADRRRGIDTVRYY